jgi:hypothetical protein
LQLNLLDATFLLSDAAMQDFPDGFDLFHITVNEGGWTANQMHPGTTKNQDEKMTPAQPIDCHGQDIGMSR